MRSPASAPARRSVLAVVATACLAAACTSTAAPGGGGAGGATGAVAPTPIPIALTTPSGALSFLGPVMRVTFDALPEGRVTAIDPTVATVAPGASSPLPGELPSVTIGYRQVGSGQDIVLVAGEDATLSWWDPALLQQLGAHFRLTIFDLPGVGYSGADGDDAPSIESYADVTAGLIVALGLTKPVVLGWGMGGQVALELALRHRGLASRLVLADTSQGGPSSAPTPPAVAAELADPAVTPRALARLFFPPDASRLAESWLRSMALEPPDDVVAGAVAAEATAERSWWHRGVAPSALRRIAVPVLVVSGAEDQVFPRRDAAALARALPDARQVLVPGSGYAAIFSASPSFSQALGRLVAPAPGQSP